MVHIRWPLCKVIHEKTWRERRIRTEWGCSVDPSIGALRVPHEGHNPKDNPGGDARCELLSRMRAAMVTIGAILSAPGVKHCYSARALRGSQLAGCSPFSN
jgi:hypothetical protein